MKVATCSCCNDRMGYETRIGLSIKVPYRTTNINKSFDVFLCPDCISTLRIGVQHCRSVRGTHLLWQLCGLCSPFEKVNSEQVACCDRSDHKRLGVLFKNRG